MRINANEEGFEVVELLGKQALFTSRRIDHATVPAGAYCYYIRHADDDGMVAAEIKPHIMVNHMGTILMTEPLDFGEDGCIILDEDVNFADGYFTLAEFSNASNTSGQDLQIGGLNL